MAQVLEKLSNTDFNSPKFCSQEAKALVGTPGPRRLLPVTSTCEQVTGRTDPLLPIFYSVSCPAYALPCSSAPAFHKLTLLVLKKVPESSSSRFSPPTRLTLRSRDFGTSPRPDNSRLLSVYQVTRVSTNSGFSTSRIIPFPAAFAAFACWGG